MAINSKNQELLDGFKYYLDYSVDENKRRSNTVKGYYADTVQFMKYIDELPAEKVQFENATEWIKSLKGRNGSLTAASKNRKKASIRAFYKYLVSKHIIENDPLILLTPETITKGEDGNQITRDWLDVDEIEKLKKALNREAKHPHYPVGCVELNVKMNALRWRALYHLMLETGLRVSEIAGLERHELKVDQAKGYYVVIPAKKSKNKKARTVPVPQYVFEYIKMYRESLNFTPENQYIFLSQNGMKLDANMINRKLKEYAEMANISKELTNHSLRHTFASYKLNVENISATVVAGWMGHNSNMLEKIYYHQDEMDGEVAI